MGARAPGSHPSSASAVRAIPAARRGISASSPVKIPASRSIPALVRRISIVSRGCSVEKAPSATPCSTTPVRIGVRRRTVSTMVRT